MHPSTHSISFVKQILISKNIEPVNFQFYKNAHQKILARCLVCGFSGYQNNQWHVTFHNVKNHNRGCPKCRKCSKISNYEAKDILLNKNIILMSEYKNTKQKLKIKCNLCNFENQTWAPRIEHIINNRTSCPNCQREKSKSQNILIKIINKLFPNEIIVSNYRGFMWLKNKKNMEIDIFLPKYKLAIEYDGKQHFLNTSWGGEGGLAEIKHRDELKNNLISQHKEDIKHFVRISYLDELTENSVRKMIPKELF